MPISVFDLCRKQKLTKGFLLSLCGISLFYAAVCTPVFHMLSSDILLQNSMYPLLLDFLMQFLNYLFYWVAFAFLLYTYFRFDVEKFRSFLWIYALVVVLRYLANLIAGFCMIERPMWEDFLTMYLPYLLLDILLDLAQMGALIWILRSVKRRGTMQARRKGGELLLTNLPISGMFDFKNPISRSAFFASSIPAFVQLVSQIIFDLFYGAPTGLSDLLWMIFYYLLHAVYLFVGFLVLILLINHFYLNEEKARMEYEQPLPNDPV